MKKCSTAALAFAAACVAPALAGEACEFLPTAPEAHLVVRGDTLWDLASRLLDDPWCWPQLWAPNRERIANPHRIFPGQTIILDRQPVRLGRAAQDAAAPSDMPLATLLPSARVEALSDAEPIPAIDPRLLRDAARIRLVHTGAVASAARIVGFTESRRIASQTDVALVRGQAAAGRMDVMRRLPQVLDPDSGEPLAVPLRLVGSARLLGPDPSGLQRVVVEASNSELLAGDLLLPSSPAPLNIPATMTAASVEGKVAAVMGGQNWAAQRDIVAINRGSNDGLGAGDMVGVFAHVRIGDDDPVHLPPSQRVAQLLVFQVLDRAALALVMRSSDVFSAGAAVGPLGRPDGQR